MLGHGLGTGNFSSAVTWSTNAGQISSSVVDRADCEREHAGDGDSDLDAGHDQVGNGDDTVTPTAAANNVAPLVVDAGPDPQNVPVVNVPFVTITICVPGTQTCQTIDHVAVDTGSSGLRIVSSVLSIPLPPAERFQRQSAG